MMQGQTIPLQYGRWVQWDQTSWVGSMQTYRYGVLNGLQVEMDFAQVGLMLRRRVVPGVTHSLALQGNVAAAPKNRPTTEGTRSEEEETDPGVPFEHGMVQPGRKPPPQAWFQRQGMQDWMNRMAKQPAGPPPHGVIRWRKWGFRKQGFGKNRWRFSKAFLQSSYKRFWALLFW